MGVDISKWFKTCVWRGEAETICEETEYGTTWTCPKCGHKESITYIKSIGNPEPRKNPDYLNIPENISGSIECLIV